MLREELAWLPHIFGFLGIALTLSTLYMQFWKPFDPKVQLSGRYSLCPNPIGNRVYQTNIHMGLSFSNRGARIGFVELLYISLKSESGQDYRYISVFNNLADRIYFASSKESMPPGLELEKFLAFPIAPNASVSKEVVFSPEDYKTARLPSGAYSASVFVKFSNKDDFVPVETVRMEIDKTDYEGFPSVNTFEEAQKAYSGPYYAVLPSKDKILPSLLELLHRSK